MMKRSSKSQVTIWEKMYGVVTKLYEQYEKMCMKQGQNRFVSIHGQSMISMKANKVQENRQEKPGKMFDISFRKVHDIHITP